MMKMDLAQVLLLVLLHIVFLSDWRGCLADPGGGHRHQQTPSSSSLSSAHLPVEARSLSLSSLNPNNLSPLPSGCYVAWVRGHKLAEGLRVDRNTSLEECKFECFRLPSCAAFAYGEGLGECELATRRSRSLNNYPGGGNFKKENVSEVDVGGLRRTPTHDVYIEREGCGPPNGALALQSKSTAPIPRDCFYRLMSGKRLVKNHVLRATSVPSLEECQAECVQERNFECSAVSYRYMPSGYTYNVANCELSNFFVSEKLSSSRFDFIDDYDYDFFQREPKCKQAQNQGFAVCSRVSRRATRLSTYAKGASVQALSQCEYLCATAFFSCRAFAFRTTERGRERVSALNFPDNCLLYDVDLERSKDTVSDRDFDSYTLGTIVNGECTVTTSQSSNNNNNGPPPEFHGRRPSSGPDRGPDRDRDRFTSSDFHHFRPTSNNYLPETGPPTPSHIPPQRIRPGSVNDRLSPPTLLPPHLEHSGPSGPPPPYPTHFRPSGGPPDDRPFPIGHDRDRARERPSPIYPPPPPTFGGGPSNGPLIASLPPHSLSAGDRQGECLVKLRADYFIEEDRARATFPAKTLEECKSECLRSLQVLRFPCKALAYRLTSSAGGSCQLSDVHLTTRDFVSARERDNAVIFVNEAECGNEPPPRLSSSYPPPERGPPPSNFPDRYQERPLPHRFPNHPRFPPPSPESRYPHPTQSQEEEFSRPRPRPRPRPHNYPPEAQRRHPEEDTRFPYDQERRRRPHGPPRDRDRDRYESTGPPRTRYPPPPPPQSSRYPPQEQQQRERERYPQEQQRYPPSGPGKVKGGPRVGVGEVRHTVTGERCLTACRQNREAGFHYCIVDNQGSWDFCCRPDHFCGYSRGLSVPWCYVGEGPSASIWRSCNLRLLKSRQKTSYLHDREPPAILELSNDLLANLTKSDLQEDPEDQDRFILPSQTQEEEEEDEQLESATIRGQVRILRPSEVAESTGKGSGQDGRRPIDHDGGERELLEGGASNQTNVYTRSIVEVRKSVSHT